jgi:deoxyribonuclease-4
MIRFGPGGNSLSFYNEGHKSTIEAPKWLYEKGLSLYEYECGQGVRISKDTAKKFGEEAKKYDIEVTVHAPYFISLASLEEQKRKNSINYILQTLEACKNMGGRKVVVHPGGCSDRDREEAYLLAEKTMREAVQAAYDNGYEDMIICPETMGKINQIGTVDEIIRMCKLDKMLIPTVDFGHINAREMGSLKTEEDYDRIIYKMIEELGIEKVKNLHIHFSKVEYTKGGEKRHLTFSDTVYGPEFPPLAKVLKKYELEPTVVCESDGTMAEDALIMKEVFMNENR